MISFNLKGDISLISNKLNNVVALFYADYADGATEPIDFPIAPRFSTEKLLKQVGMTVKIGLIIT